MFRSLRKSQEPDVSQSIMVFVKSSFLLLFALLISKDQLKMKNIDFVDLAGIGDRQKCFLHY